MINKMNDTLKRVNQKVGVDIDIPTPTKKSLNKASMLTATLGTAFVIVGVAASSKWCTVVGGVSLLSSVLQRKESNSLK